MQQTVVANRATLAPIVEVRAPEGLFALMFPHHKQKQQVYELLQRCQNYMELLNESFE